MKKPKSFGQFRHAVLTTVLASALAATASAAPAEPVQLLFKPKNGQTAALDALLRSRGAETVGSIPQLDVHILRVPAVAADLLLNALKNHNDVEYAEPDFVAKAIGTSNDPYFTNGSQWHLPKIQAPTAWDTTTGSAAITVAVIDTGVAASHPDLAGKILSGYDFVANDSDPTDENGHGTAVSGTISPNTNNGTGVAGVSWATPILPVRVLDASGSGTYSAISNGITYAADRGARILNLSLGGTSSSTTLQSAVNYAWNKGCVVIAAAGNNGNSTPCYPAACTNVVAVSATDSNDVRPSWSNFGSYVDLAAPGVSITTTYTSNSYVSISGTSFSSPITAGVAALMASVNPALTNANLVSLLVSSTDDIGTAGYDVYYGSGRVNASRAVAAAAASITPEPPPPAVDATAPTVAITSPAEGSTVSATSQNITVNASDNVGVTKVALYVDGKLLATSTSATPTFVWNTKRVKKGLHKLQAYGYDAAGNIGYSVIVNVYR